jgi:hypothetical protein
LEGKIAGASGKYVPQSGGIKRESNDRLLTLDASKVLQESGSQAA